MNISTTRPFDPNSATGIALDNLLMISGVTELKCDPKPCMYTQLLAIEGVTNVQMFDFEDKGCGVYVEGGSDEDITEAMSMHTYSWNRNWFVGDTSVLKEFFTAWFYRDYNVFISEFKKLTDQK